MNQTPNQSKNSDGIPVPVVAVGALILLGLILAAAYFLAVELGNTDVAKSVSTAVEQAKNQVQGVVDQSNTSDSSAIADKHEATSTSSTSNAQTTTVEETNKQESAQVPASSLQTYDIGAYLTYGNKASILKRAVARLSSDSKRLIVGLFEESQSAKEKPALGIIFEMKEARSTCSVSNIKEITLLFNLKAMGDIPAQKTELTLKSASEIQAAVNSIACDLKKGGRLDLHLLGSNPNLLKPAGSTFAWGLRLAQEIG